MSNNLDIEKIVKNVMDSMNSEQISGNIILNVSNRHMHITREHLEVLFGSEYQFELFRDLMQPGEFASTATVTIAGPNMKVIEQVRILGPERKYTQVELSQSDKFKLGIDHLPVRKSGDVAGSTPMVLIGPKGALNLKEGALRATRHIHMTPADEIKFNVKNGDFVKVRVGNERALTLENVLVRSSDKYTLEMHIDTDDAAAAGINSGTYISIIK